MQTATASRTINADLSTVWPLVSDVRQIAHWHPSIATVDLLSTKATGLHAARRCNFKDGTSVREEVTDLAESKRIRFRLSEFSENETEIGCDPWVIQFFQSIRPFIRCPFLVMQ